MKNKMTFYKSLKDFVKGEIEMVNFKKTRLELIGLLKFTNDTDLIKSDIKLDKHWSGSNLCFKHPLAKDPLYIMFDYTEDIGISKALFNSLRASLYHVGGEINATLLNYLCIENAIKGTDGEESNEEYAKYIIENCPKNEIRSNLIAITAAIDSIFHNNDYVKIMNKCDKIRSIYLNLISTVEKMLSVYEFYMLNEKTTVESDKILSTLQNIKKDHKLYPEIVSIRSNDLDEIKIGEQLITTLTSKK